MNTRAKVKRTGTKLRGLIPDPKEIREEARRKAMTVCGFTRYGGKPDLRRESLKMMDGARSTYCKGKVHVCPYKRKTKGGKTQKVGNKKRGHCRGKPKKK